MIRDARPDDALPSITKEIDQDRINRWATISGDFNKLHVDPEYAKGTPFGGTIMHGPMSLAFLNELMMECFGERWAVGGRLLDVRFVAPIRPGDRIRITGTVKEVRGAEIECDLYIQKEGGEKAVVGRGIGISPGE
jgi:3-hydroxybutyryl-CoA dehydratase